MKKLKVLLISMIALFAFTIASQNNINASTWHKGTPKTLRGTYISTYKKGPNEGFTARTKITIKFIDMIQSNYPVGHITRLKYKRIHKNKYNVVGTMQKSGFIPKQKMNQIYIKKGKYLYYGSKIKNNKIFYSKYKAMQSSHK